VVKRIRSSRRHLNAALRLAQAVPFDQDEEMAELLGYSVNDIRQVLDELSEAVSS
jgi:transcription initiation factor IIE alpha subunit